MSPFSNKARSQLETIGIAELAVSTDVEATLITYALGSCVGVALYDRELRAGGMVHCMLPLSKRHKERAAQRPLMFVDTGVGILLQKMFDLGARRKSLQAKLAGGAGLINSTDQFRIGERNIVVARKILWKNNVMLSGEEVGGSKSRTMVLGINDGRCCVRTAGKETVL